MKASMYRWLRTIVANKAGIRPVGQFDKMVPTGPNVLPDQQLVAEFEQERPP